MNEHIKPIIEAAASGPLSHDEALNAFEISKSYDIKSISKVYGQMYHRLVSSLYKSIDN